MEDMIPVKDAGIVILTNYIPVLFDRLGLTSLKQFRDRESQEKAVLYLQYLATGLEGNEANLLSLNKVLCGMRPDDTLTTAITVTDSDKQLMNGLLLAVIGYWPSIGQSSVAGFQGNWLVRDGMLREEGEQWTLQVDRRAYDVLLRRSPFSFDIVRFRWMEKTLHVMWNY